MYDGVRFLRDEGSGVLGRGYVLFSKECAVDGKFSIPDFRHDTEYYKTRNIN